jgi:hypothetical protein
MDRYDRFPAPAAADTGHRGPDLLAESLTLPKPPFLVDRGLSIHLDYVFWERCEGVGTQELNVPLKMFVPARRSFDFLIRPERIYTDESYHSNDRRK